MAAAPDDTAAPEPPEAPPAGAAAAAPAAATDADQEGQQAPIADPDTCRGVAICQEALEEAVLAGELDGSPYLFYLEPPGVLRARLVCARAHPPEPEGRHRAGILMTKAARDAKTVFFDDGINPERYDLSFPKEFGYVKSIQHYRPDSREHAKYPWSKKY